MRDNPRWRRLVVADRRIETIKSFPWGDETIEVVVDPKGKAERTTWEFYETEGEAGYGKLRQMVGPTGYWERYAYDVDGRKTKAVRMFLDSPLESPDEQCRVTEYSYAPVHPDDNGATRPHSPRLVVERLKGIETSRTYHVYLPHEKRTIRCAERGASWDAPENLISITRYLAEGTFAGKTASVRHENGTVTLYDYQLDENGNLITTVDSGAPSEDGTTVVAGSRSVSVQNKLGHSLSSSTYDIASGILTDYQENTEFDSFGRVTRTDYLDGTWSERKYGCCGVDWERDREGHVTTYQYDDQKRLIATTDQSTNLTTRHDYDAAGNQVATWQIAHDGTELLVSRSEYAGGDLIATYDAAGNRAEHKEEIIDGVQISTTLLPNQATSIQRYYPDRQLRETAGTAAWPQRYEYGVDERGEFSATMMLDLQGVPRRATYSYTDLLGRSYLTIFPDGSESRQIYDAKGHLAESIQPDGQILLYADNAQGQIETTAIDMNRNHRIDYDGGDIIARTITETAEKTLSDGSTVPVVRTRSWDWPDAGKGEPRLIATTERSIDGRHTWETRFDRTTEMLTDYGSKADDSFEKRVTNTAPDGSRQVDTYRAGRLVKQRQLDSAGDTAAITDYTYDVFGRLTVQRKQILKSSTMAVPTVAETRWEYDRLGQLTAERNAEGGVTRYDYDKRGNRLAVTDPNGNTTRYQYDERNRQIAEIDALGNITRKEYDDYGHLTAIIDANGNPTRYAYDDLGQKVSDTYADNSVYSYDYDEQGRLLHKQDPRGSFFTYHYDGAGRLTAIKVVPGPDVPNRSTLLSYRYDEAGRMIRAADNVDPEDPTDDVIDTWTYSRNGAIVDETQAIGDFVKTVRTEQVPEDFAMKIHYPSGPIVTITSDPADGRQVYDKDGDMVLTVIPDLATGQFAQKRYGNGMHLTYSYDKMGRTTEMLWEHKEDQKLLAGFRYRYDAAGNTISEEKFHLPDHSSVYDYDQLNRIVGYREGRFDRSQDDVLPLPIHTQTWQLDALHNWQSATEDGKPLPARQHNKVNQITHIGDKTLNYDANGNSSVLPRENGPLYLQFDPHDRLASVESRSASSYIHYWGMHLTPTTTTCCGWLKAPDRPRRLSVTEPPETIVSKGHL